eukprot:748797-Rhodomonas_salina.2
MSDTEYILSPNLVKRFHRTPWMLWNQARKIAVQTKLAITALLLPLGSDIGSDIVDRASVLPLCCEESHCAAEMCACVKYRVNQRFPQKHFSVSSYRINDCPH